MFLSGVSNLQCTSISQVFFHDKCQDGLMAAAAVYDVMLKKVAYTPIQYGDGPMSELVAGVPEQADLMFVDWCPTAELMQQMVDLKVPTIRVIDHHWDPVMKTVSYLQASAEWELQLSETLAGFHLHRYKHSSGTTLVMFYAEPEAKLSGAGLTHLYVDHNKFDLDLLQHAKRLKVPGSSSTSLALSLANNYDVWDHSHPGVVPFKVAIAAEGLLTKQPATDRVKAMHRVFRSDDLTSDLVEQGKGLIKFRDEWIADIVNTTLFVMPMADDEGHTVLVPCVVATNREASAICQYIYTTLPWYGCACVVNIMPGFGVGLSFRSDQDNPDSYDVSKIARQYGGNGHRHAAGGKMNEHLFSVMVHSRNVIRNVDAGLPLSSQRELDAHADRFMGIKVYTGPLGYSVGAEIYLHGSPEDELLVDGLLKMVTPGKLRVILADTNTKEVIVEAGALNPNIKLDEYYTYDHPFDDHINISGVKPLLLI